MKLPPLTALRAFETASRHRSLSAAARELNVIHAAIAQQVKKLEEWFSFTLMQRSRRGVKATAPETPALGWKSPLAFEAQAA